MGVGASNYSDKSEQEARQRFIQNKLRQKHLKVVRLVEELMVSTNEEHDAPAINKQVQSLMKSSIESLRRSVAPNTPQHESRETTQYFFSRSTPDAFVRLEWNGGKASITCQYPIDCILARGACIRVLGLVLKDIQVATTSRVELATLFLPAYIQLNVLIAIAALGFFLQSKGKQNNNVKFCIRRDWPMPVPPDMRRGGAFPNAAALQFHTIWNDARNCFYTSEFCTQKLLFEWRRKSSPRFKRMAYLKRQNMLNMEKFSKIRESLEDVDDKNQPMYVEYEHMGHVNVSFLGSVNDVLKKFRLLPSGARGKKDMLDARVHTFPLVRPRLAMVAARTYADRVLFEDQSLPSVNVSVLMGADETFLRRSNKMLTPEHVRATVHRIEARTTGKTDVTGQQLIDEMQRQIDERI